MPSEEKGKRSRLRLIIGAVTAFVLVPLFIFLGMTVWNDRKYYIVSLIIIALSMVPFALRFEKKRQTARELVVLAAMIAIGVAGRAAFYMLPQVKPIVAITIITGIAFGCESGFIAGAMIAFVSNFLFIQGPWTPWQMEALGLMGFFAGLIFHRKDGRIPRLIPLLVYGALGTFIIYGFIVDTSTVFTVYSSEVTWKLALSTYAAGVPMNLVNAGATVVFLLLLARPMLKKLNRVRVKYGILEE
ncbi:MAG: ECF transporter S component [Clostridiales bacterium]|nr:ECF transporter S component [Clostridiales bacterium]